MRHLFSTSLLVTLLTVAASGQSLPSLHVGVKPHDLRLVQAQQHWGELQQQHAPSQSSLQATLLASEDLGEGVVKNLYQCTIDGKWWNGGMTQSAPTWTTYVTFDSQAQTATFTNLIGVCGDYLMPSDVTAPYVDGVITLPTLTFDGTSGSTRLGLFYYMYDCYLAAGDYDAASGDILLDDELKITVSDDLQTLRTDNKTLAVVYDYGMGTTVIGYAQDPHYDFAVDAATSAISTRSLEFGRVNEGGTGTAAFTITATGVKDVPYTIQVEGDAFSYLGAEDGTIYALQTKTFNIQFTPTAGGEYTGLVKVQAVDSLYEVVLHGTCVSVPNDFSPIVVEGDASLLTWSNVSEYPWALDEQNHAIPGNVGVQPEWDESQAEDPEYNPQTWSDLGASYNASKALRLTFDVTLNDDASDSLRFSVDDYRLFTWSNTKLTTYTYSCILPKGSHKLTWSYNTCLWCEANATPSISNMHIELVDECEGIANRSDLSLFAEGFQNVNGTAISQAADGLLYASVEVGDQPMFIAFDYEGDGEGFSFVAENYTAGDSHEATLMGSGKVGYTLTRKGTYDCFFSTTSADRAIVRNLYVGEGEWSSIKRTYQVSGRSYYTTSDAYMAEGGYNFNYKCDVTIDADGRVYFDGLFPATSHYPRRAVIEGRIESDGKVHVSALHDWNLGTLYGWDDDTYAALPAYIGNRFWVIAGTVENGERQPADELLFSISDDQLTLTEEAGMGLWMTWNSNSNTDHYAYWMPGTSFIAQTDSYQLHVDHEAIDFGTSYPGVAVTGDLYVTNPGADNLVSVNIVGNQASAFSVSGLNGRIAQFGAVDAIVTFQAEEPGEYDAELHLSNQGDMIVVALHGVIEANADYSAIVDEGAELLTWKSTSAYPWAIEGNVAHSTNVGVMSSHSSITAQIDVPEGQVGTFAFQAASYPEPGYDSFRFYDGDSIYTYSVYRNDSIIYQQILSAGHHDLKFDFYKDNIDEVYFRGDSAAVSHVRVSLQQAGPALHIPSASFTEIVPVGDTYYADAYLVNAGTAPFTLEGIDGDDHFGARMPGNATCQPGDTLHVYTSFEADEPGSYAGNVTFRTSAGDLVLPLHATADHVLYLSGNETYNYGYPYPTAWTAIGYDNVNTQVIYNADLTNELEGRDLTEMTFFSYVISEAPLTCPDVEYQIGTTSKAAVYDLEAKGLTTVYHGAQPVVDNFEMTVPFSEPYHFEGGNLEVQLLLRGSESFRVQFPWLCSVVNDEYPQCSGVSSRGELTTDSAILPYVRFRYSVQNPEAIRTVSGSEARTVTDLHVYDLQGRELQHMEPGFCVTVTTYSDGTQRTVRQYVK